MKIRKIQFVCVTIMSALLLAGCSQDLIETTPVTSIGQVSTTQVTIIESPSASPTNPNQEISQLTPTSSSQVQTTKDNQAATSQTAPVLESPTNQSPDASQSTQEPFYIQAAIQDLMTQFNLSRDMIKIQSIEPVEWPDSSLGCPLPGINYTQTNTQGYLVTLEALDITYTYHTDTGTKVILCSDAGFPFLPDIPIPTDEEIMDGIPWVPVD